MIPDHILVKVKLSSTSGLLGMYNSFLICVVIHCVTCAPFVVPEQLTVVSTSTCSLVLIVYRGYSLSIGFSATIVVQLYITSIVLFMQGFCIVFSTSVS